MFRMFSESVRRDADAAGCLAISHQPKYGDSREKINDSRIFARTVETVVIPTTTEPATTPRPTTTGANHARAKGRRILNIITTRPPRGHPRNRLPQAPPTRPRCAHVPFKQGNRGTTDGPTAACLRRRRGIVSRFEGRVLDHAVGRVCARGREGRSLLLLLGDRGSEEGGTREGAPSRAKSLSLSGRGGKGRTEPGSESGFRVVLFLPMMLVCRGGKMGHRGR